MQHEDTVEADPAVGLDDGVSIDDQLSSLTSLTSSVVNYPVENGRRYHAFRSGSYPLPNDEPELDRLDLSHRIMTSILGDKLYLAPIKEDRLHRVLDLGTGTGIWAIEFAETVPNAEVLGNDLSPIQSTWVPPNVRFEVDDVESPWLHEKHFDYVFSRYMAACILDWPRYMKHAFDHIVPGGWVEYQDFDLDYACDDDTVTPEHSLRVWMTNLMEASRRIGRNPAPGPSLESWVTEAGFKDVTASRHKIPIGTWPKNPTLKEVGLWNLAQVLEGLEAFSLRLFCDVLGWRSEEVLLLLSRVRKELKSGMLHAYLNFYVVYGRKP